MAGEPGSGKHAGEEPEKGSWLLGIGVADPTPVTSLPPSRKERLEGDDLEQSIKLKRFYGLGILLLMGLQLVVVNAVFVIYAMDGYDWRPPESVVQVWLTATFVQIVSVVVVITRSLFPGEKNSKE
ncbi:MAG TPA: hypothetical protein VMS60_02225 [Solirubrobacterales bacterium]|nr:hypothetical protein [Solirubrobacterales bacterium]